jgi:riboflavin kinase/FMN adenylyltransferase
MNTIRGLENLPGEQSRCVVTDGTFDGVHLGHQALLRRTVALAEARGVASCVVTYDPPPSEFFFGGAKADRLTHLEEKLGFFRAAGLDLCAILRFDRVLSEWDAGQFARQVFREGLGVVAVVAGAGHTFGAGGRGTLATLRRLGAEMGFAVESVPDAVHEGERVSSSIIRDTLRRGDVAKAAAMLGRPYAVCATVIPGKGVGEGLGYPTANLPMDDRKLLPADGVYAGHACAGEERYPAVAHVGGSPTFDEAKRLVEVHVPDRHLELDGRKVCFEMTERIRAPIRFASHEQLKRQIQADVEQARRTLQCWNAGAAASTLETE